MKRLHILKPGTFAAHNGGDITITPADLADIAAGYDPARHEAPLVVGHPKLNAPAFGWVKSLAVSDGQLTAEPQQVNADFADLVRDGAYKKISVSLFPPAHAGNPTPGKWGLRHVGFLGAQPPAVKGLRGVEFAADDTDCLTIEFAEAPVRDAIWSASRLMRQLRDWLIGEKGLATADQVLPDYQVGALEGALRDLNAADAATPSFAEGAPAPFKEPPVPDPKKPDPTADLAEREAKVTADATALAAREAAVAQREKAIADQASAAHRAQLVQFADGLVTAGQLLPAEKAIVVELASALDAAQVVEFGEGDGKTSATRLDAFKGLLKALPARVPLGSLPGANANAAPVDFAAADGVTVDAERLEIHRKAQAHMRQHNTTYDAAVAAVASN